MAFSYGSGTDAAKALAETTGATAVQSDAADRAAVIELVARHGPLDGLIVNAGLLVGGDPLTPSRRHRPDDRR